MPIPHDKIKEDLKSKKLTRLNQLFEYAPIPEWKEAMGCRKGLIERIIEDPKRIIWRWEVELAEAAKLKHTTILRLIKGQRSHNLAMKRAGDRSQEPPGERPGTEPSLR